MTGAPGKAAGGLRWGDASFVMDELSFGVRPLVVVMPRCTVTRIVAGARVHRRCALVAAMYLQLVRIHHEIHGADRAPVSRERQDPGASAVDLEEDARPPAHRCYRPRVAVRVEARLLVGNVAPGTLQQPAPVGPASRSPLREERPQPPRSRQVTWSGWRKGTSGRPSGSATTLWPATPPIGMACWQDMSVGWLEAAMARATSPATRCAPHPAREAPDPPPIGPPDPAPPTGAR